MLKRGLTEKEDATNCFTRGGKKGKRLAQIKWESKAIKKGSKPRSIKENRVNPKKQHSAGQGFGSVKGTSRRLEGQGNRCGKKTARSRRRKRGVP